MSTAHFRASYGAATNGYYQERERCVIALPHHNARQVRSVAYHDSPAHVERLGHYLQGGQVGAPVGKDEWV